MDHFAASGGSYSEFYTESGLDELRKRIKEIEDRLGITAEREKEARAKLFKRKREMVLDRREARKEGIDLQTYYSRQQFWNNALMPKIPKAVLDQYNALGKK